jgi:tRNA pseudouridine55 synthase
MFGLVLLDKPAGWTSRDAVDRVKRLAKPVKVGHAGTLDPLATGLLVVLAGRATKLVGRVQRMPKRYRAEFLLGRRSPSDDVDTEIETLDDPRQPSREDLLRMLPRFTGCIAQRPPAFAAIKIAGQRAYRLARRGVEVAAPSRNVEIYSLELVDYDYPRMTLQVECSGGTYVRSLGRDVAESLGSSAVMSALRRTRIGPFDVAAALDPEQLDWPSLRRAILPPQTILEGMPIAQLDQLQFQLVQFGRLLKEPRPADPAVSLKGIPEIAALAPDGQLAAILQPAKWGLWKPSPNFVGHD